MISMTKIYSLKLLLLLVIVLCSCEAEKLEPQQESVASCAYTGTIEDHTGLDGCGYLIRLDNGNYLEPVRRFFCGTPPLPEDAANDPLMNFEFEHGKRVTLNYEVTEEFGSICMKGELVIVTCIEEVNTVAD